jgi:hypothetical protein
VSSDVVRSVKCYERYFILPQIGCVTDWVMELMGVCGGVCGGGGVGLGVGWCGATYSVQYSRFSSAAVLLDTRCTVCTDCQHPTGCRVLSAECNVGRVKVKATVRNAMQICSLVTKTRSYRCTNW